MSRYPLISYVARFAITSVVGFVGGFFLVLCFGTFLLGLHPSTIHQNGEAVQYWALFPHYLLYILITGGVPVFIASFFISRRAWVIRPEWALPISWIVWFFFIGLTAPDIPPTEIFTDTQFRDHGISLSMHYMASVIIVPIAAMLGSRAGNQKKANQRVHCTDAERAGQ
jgi:hypothetical protein